MEDNKTEWVILYCYMIWCTYFKNYIKIGFTAVLKNELKNYGRSIFIRISGTAIPKDEYEACSKVPMKDRRSIFERFSSIGSISKSWSIQNLHQTSKSDETNKMKISSFSKYLPTGAKKPLPLVGTHSPAQR